MHQAKLNTDENLSHFEEIPEDVGVDRDGS
jgi:hypothetical protein